MQTVNTDVLLTSIFEKQIAIHDLADQLANEFDDIKNSDRSKAVAIRDLADKQQEHLNELENKLEARGDDLKPQDYESLCEERGDKLESCIRTLEEIKAIADLLTMSAGGGDQSYFDDTLENIGCLITSRVEAALEEINTKPAVSEEEHGGGS